MKKRRNRNERKKEKGREGEKDGTREGGSDFLMTKLIMKEKRNTILNKQ